MQWKTFNILRRTGAFRLALIYYATIIPAFPLVVFVMAGFEFERALELFVLSRRGAYAMLLAPVAMGVFLLLSVWIALCIERRRGSDAA